MVVYFERNGQQFGPYPLEDARKYVAENRFLPSDRAWMDGMAEWAELRTIAQLAPPQQRPAPASAPPAPPFPGAALSASPSLQKPAAQPAPYAQPAAPHAAPGWQGAPAAPAFPIAAMSQNAEYAGFWRRCAALVIDSIIVAVVFGILGGILGALLGGVLAAVGTGGGSPELMTGFAVLMQIFFYFVIWAYFAWWYASPSMASPGKMAMGLIVVDGQAQKLTFLRGFGREAAKLISGIILGIGYLMQPFTGRKQALHDMIASTVVLRKSADAGAPSIVVWLVNLVIGVFPILILVAIAIPAYYAYLERARG